MSLVKNLNTKIKLPTKLEGKVNSWLVYWLFHFGISFRRFIIGLLFCCPLLVQSTRQPIGRIAAATLVTAPHHQAVTRVAAAILRWPDSLIELKKCNRTTRHDEPTQTGSKVNSSINTRITIHFPSDIVNSYNTSLNHPVQLWRSSIT
mgnify:CR=1 FL=1